MCIGMYGAVWGCIGSGVARGALWLLLSVYRMDGIYCVLAVKLSISQRLVYSCDSGFYRLCDAQVWWCDRRMHLHYTVPPVPQLALTSVKIWVKAV